MEWGKLYTFHCQPEGARSHEVCHRIHRLAEHGIIARSQFSCDRAVAVQFFRFLVVSHGDQEACRFHSDHSAAGRGDDCAISTVVRVWYRLGALCWQKINFVMNVEPIWWLHLLLFPFDLYRVVNVTCLLISFCKQSTSCPLVRQTHREI